MTLIVEGTGARKKPKPTILVCSDGAYDDLSAVKQVATTYFADENYEILDAKNLHNEFEFESKTFAYFGSVSAKTELPECLGLVPGVLEYAKLKHVLAEQEALTLSARLQKQFKTKKNVAGPTMCSFGAASTDINGQTFNWSVQLRNSSKSRCAESYFSLFGFHKLCLTAACGYDETEKILSELK